MTDETTLTIDGEEIDVDEWTTNRLIQLAAIYDSSVEWVFNSCLKAGVSNYEHDEVLGTAPRPDKQFGDD